MKMNFNWEKSTLDVLGWISIIYESLQPFKKVECKLASVLGWVVVS